MLGSISSMNHSGRLLHRKLYFVKRSMRLIGTAGQAGSIFSLDQYQTASGETAVASKEVQQDEKNCSWNRH
jgi:hypothetical protein